MSTSAPKRSTGNSLYAFSLPPSLLGDLQPRQLHIPESHPLFPRSQQPKAIEDEKLVTNKQLAITAGSGGAFTCALTGASFDDLAGLREHYKTDWYKYNAKLKAQGKPTGVGEEDFNALVDGLSLSGSDSSSSSSSDGESSSSSTNAVSRLLRKQHFPPPNDGSPLDPDEDPFDPSGPRSALIWYEAPSFAPGTQYGLYRALLPLGGAGKHRSEGSEVLDELRQLQLKEGNGEEAKPRQWTLMMFGGGHFAGMVVSLVPKMVSVGKGKEKEREVVVIKQKTFHRYTTRRKQGGSQSAHDGGKGKAKSIGAQIRRYNETALTDEVQELLVSWSEEISNSELVFLRASKTNHKTFFGFDGCPIDRKDPRIRGYSFPTRRPTINELLRAFHELTRLRTSHLTPEALATLDAQYLSSLKLPAPPPTASQSKPPVVPRITLPKLTKAEELERDRWERCIDMVRKGKVDVLTSFLDKYGPELESGSSSSSSAWGSLPPWHEDVDKTPTLLHVAALSDQAQMVHFLLTTKRSDPTLLTSSLPPRTAYELSPSRATRNVFRLLVTEHPDWWDWTGAARVPSGLDAEKEEERDQKSRDRRAKLRDQIKAREKEREAAAAVEKEKEEKERLEQEQRELLELARTRGNKVEKTGHQRLGGAPSAKIAKALGAGGPALTEQQRMRVEREQRARAAEARMKAMKDAEGQ